LVFRDSPTGNNSAKDNAYPSGTSAAARLPQRLVLEAAPHEPPGLLLAPLVLAAVISHSGFFSARRGASKVTPVVAPQVE
jgi:hypothetical protein